MQVNRLQLLSSLETVSSGLASKEIVEQSGCFVFKGESVITFNDEVAVRMQNPLGIEGAVQAAPLLTLLKRLTEDDLEVEVTEKGLQVSGKNRRAVISMQSEVLLPVEGIEEPGKWKALPKGLLEAMRIASSCCSVDESHFVLTCVHVTEDRVEASDDYQIISYPIETGVLKPFLLRRDSVAKLASIEPTSWSRTENWMHFKNKAGVVLSCRLFVEKYPDIRKHLEVDGNEATFPQKIDAILDKAQIFSSENPVGNHVEVSLSPGRLRIEGKGPSGSYREQQKISYKGEALSFRIEPRLLSEISKKSDKCVVGEGRIKVDAPNFVYVTCTAAVEE